MTGSVVCLENGSTYHIDCWENMGDWERERAVKKRGVFVVEMND